MSPCPPYDRRPWTASIMCLCDVQKEADGIRKSIERENEKTKKTQQNALNRIRATSAKVITSFCRSPAVV